MHILYDSFKSESKRTLVGKILVSRAVTNNFRSGIESVCRKWPQLASAHEGRFNRSASIGLNIRITLHVHLNTIVKRYVFIRTTSPYPPHCLLEEIRPLRYINKKFESYFKTEFWTMSLIKHSNTHGVMWTFGQNFPFLAIVKRQQVGLVLYFVKMVFIYSGVWIS